jgi:hypothetical protein
MPWYNENLDYDLENELDQRKITKGKFLDLGTGPATQAIWLLIYQNLQLKEQETFMLIRRILIL